MHPPENIYTAITAATYISLRIAHPNEDITVKDNEDNSRTFYIGQAQHIELPSLEKLTSELEHRSNYRILIGPYDKGVYLNIHKDCSFGISYDYSEHYKDELSGLQERTERAFDKTGFTPTTRFRWLNSLALRRYGFSFDLEKWRIYRASLIKRYKSQVNDTAVLEEASVEETSCRYLDMLVEKEDTICKIPKSTMKRLSGLGLAAGCALGAYFAEPEFFKELGDNYLSLLYRYGAAIEIITKMITNSAFITTGDIIGRWLRGENFDLKRSAGIGIWGLAYGVQYEALCQSLEFIPNQSFFGKIERTLSDIVAYSNFFAIQHGFATRNFKGKRTKDIAKKLAKLQLGCGIYWGPFQYYNQNFADPQRRILNMNLMFIPWSIFLGVVFNENRERDEVKDVVRRLKEKYAKG